MPVTVEGLEIATVGLPTTHGDPLGPGPGALTVLVNGKPVWRVGMDFHKCSQFDGPKPHVGGNVAKGAIKTRIGGGFAAQRTNTVIEVGPPNPITPGAVAIKSKGASGLGGVLSEIPGVPDVINLIAPDVLEQLDNLLGGELTDLFKDGLDGLKDLLPGAGSFTSFPVEYVKSLLDDVWQNRDLLKQLYALKDKSATEIFAFLASQAIRGNLESMLKSIGTLAQDVWKLPNDVIGILGGLGGEFTYDADKKVWNVKGGWLAWLNEKSLQWMTGDPKARGGITIGDFITSNLSVAERRSALTPEGLPWYDHEAEHTNQSHLLGIGYLPAILLGYAYGGVGATIDAATGHLGNKTWSEAVHDHNPLESDADDAARDALKGRGPNH